MIRVFCGFNRTPNCSSIRVAATNAARASAADVQVITQSSANLVNRYPLRRISLSNGVRRMLLSKGETTPPCGVPRSVGKSPPLTITASLEHRLNQAQHAAVGYALGHQR